MRRFVLTLVVLAAAVGSPALAETYLEKVKAVDADKRTVTFAVDGKDRTFKVDEKAEVQAQQRVGKRLRVTPLKDGLKGVKAGNEVTVTTERRAGEEVVTKVVVLVPEKK